MYVHTTTSYSSLGSLSARRTRAGGASARLTRGRIGTRAFVGATGITVFRATRHRRG